MTTSHRRSMAWHATACWGRNDDAESMTHPTDGTCGLKGPCPRRGARDSIRDGANRIDARERPSPRRRLDVFHSKRHRADTSGVYVSKGYPFDSTYPKMLDRDWRKVPKVGLEALLERFNDALHSPRVFGAGSRPICFAPPTVSPYGPSERPNAQRREEARARVTTLCGGRWSQMDSPC